MTNESGKKPNGYWVIKKADLYDSIHAVLLYRVTRKDAPVPFSASPVRFMSSRFNFSLSRSGEPSNYLRPRRGVVYLTEKIPFLPKIFSYFYTPAYVSLCNSLVNSLMSDVLSEDEYPFSQLDTGLEELVERNLISEKDKKQIKNIVSPKATFHKIPETPTITLNLVEPTLKPTVSITPLTNSTNNLFLKPPGIVESSRTERPSNASPNSRASRQKPPAAQQPEPLSLQV